MIFISKADFTVEDAKKAEVSEREKRGVRKNRIGVTEKQGDLERKPILMNGFFAHSPIRPPADSFL